MPEYMIKQKPKSKVVRKKTKSKVVRKKRSGKKLGAEEQFESAASYQDVVDEIAAESR